MKNTIKLLFIGAVCMFVLTGCGSKNNSPQEVAVEMMKILSTGDYEKTAELVSSEYASIGPKQYEQRLKYNYSELVGNKTIEVVEVEDDNTVRIQTDEKIVPIKTKEVDGKWYIDFDQYLMKDLKIIVPTKSTVKILGQDMSPYKTETAVDIEDTVLQRGGPSLTFSYPRDIYIIPAIFSAHPGYHEIEVTNKNTNTYNANIVDYDEKIVNLTVKSSDRDKVLAFYEEYFQKMLDAIEAQADFSVLSDYLDTSNTEFKTAFENSKKYIVDNPLYGTNTLYTFSNMKFNSSKVTRYSGEILYLDKDRFALFVETTYNYTLTSRNANGKNNDVTTKDSSKKYTQYLEIEYKDGKYKIINGNPILEIK